MTSPTTESFVFFVVLAYAIAFGLQNKVDILHTNPFLARMLKCTYCTGFHAGWMAWILLHLSPEGVTELYALGWWIPASILAHAFIGAGWSYTVDAVIVWLERNTPPE